MEKGTLVGCPFPKPTPLPAQVAWGGKEAAFFFQGIV
jgi:hypothetical protein